MHGGDFYNRFPTEWARRHTSMGAGNDHAAVEAELRALLAVIADETGCSIELDLRLVRERYEIDPEHPLSTALRGAYGDVTGEELAVTGVKIVADAAFFHGDCGIPAVYHGPIGSGAHGDVESVPVAELVRATKVYLADARTPLGMSGKAGYDELRAAHRWALPTRLNLGVEVATVIQRGPGDRRHGRTRDHADGHVRGAERVVEPACERPRGRRCRSGDRVAIMLSQRPETAIAHVAAYKLGAIAAAEHGVRSRRSRRPTSWL